MVNNKDNPCDFYFSDSLIPPLSYTLPSDPLNVPFYPFQEEYVYLVVVCKGDEACEIFNDL